MTARAVTASFVYCDADGRPVARVDRAEPGRDGKSKAFFPYLSEGDGFAKKSGLKGTELPLYHLDEVCRAIERGELIIFVEGEGKCDAVREALRKAGSCAAVSTIQGGCNALIRDEHLDALARALRIGILVDSDDPGRKAAVLRADTIMRRYPDMDVRIVDLYPDRSDGSDVADWLAEGNRLPDLLDRINAVAPHQVSDDEMIKQLATLSLIEYGQQRKQAAEKLGISLIILDQVVQAARRAEASAQTCASSRNGQPHSGETETGDDAVAGQRPPSVATKILQLLASAVLLRDGDRTYASFFVSGHQETHLITSASFRRYAIQEFFKQYDAAPSGTALTEALATLDAKAWRDGQSCTVATRCAEHNGRFYLDLTNEEWTVVEISAGGWKIVPAEVLPVRFVRAKDALSLPSPDPAGRISDIDVFLPDNDRIRAYIKTFMLSALRPDAPQPILAIIAPQGAGKSTIARIVKNLLDPAHSNLRGAPHERRDVTAAARNSYLLAFDNLSMIEPWLSDNLCRLSTGGGFGGRQLYTNDEEAIFDAIRPIIVTAIDDVIIRGDLADRALTIALPARDDDAGYTEEDPFWEEFELARPSILGGVLTAASVALRRLPEVRAKVRAKKINLPRMADFALFGTAAEPALGIKENAFVGLLRDERNAASVLVLESDVIFAPLRAVLEKEPFNGYPADLLDALNSAMSDDAIRRDRRWPKTAAKLRNQIKRLEPDLRRAGIVVTWADRDTHTKRQMLSIELTEVKGNPPQPPQVTHPARADRPPFAEVAAVAEAASAPADLVTEPFDI